MSIWEPTKIDIAANRGAKAGWLESIGAAFERDVPEAGFAPEARLLREAYKPFIDFTSQYVGLDRPSMMVEQPDGSAKALRVPPELEQKLVGRMPGALEAPTYEPPSIDVINEFTAWAQSQGIEVPDDLSASSLAKRRERLEVARASNVRSQEEILSRASTSARIFGGFIGSFGAQLTDAGNLATLPIGAQARVGLLATIGIEAGVNAAIEAAQTPGRNAYREMIGLEETSMLENAAFGAAFGGGLAGILKGGAKGLQAAKPYTSAGIQAVGSMVKDRMLKIRGAKEATGSDNPELRALGEAVLRDVEDEAAAVVRPDPLAVREHEARATAATIAAQTGEALDIPDRPAIAVPQASILNGLIEEIDPSTILVQPEVWQFKSDTVAAGGVTAKLLGVKEWDPSASGVVVVYEYADGARAIVDGHQRTALAGRIMAADPSQKIKLAGIVYRESEGFTRDQVRVLAALKNVKEAADGMTVRMAEDAAKILRISPEAIANLPAGPGITRARELASLADEAFSMMINRVIPADQAAAIGRMVKDRAMHGPIAKLLARVQPETAAQTESVISQAMSAPVSRETTADLFGEQEVAQSLYLERAKVLERTMRLLREDRAIFKTLSEKSGKIEGVGTNRLDAATNRSLREAMEKALVAVSALAHRAGPISEALNDAAQRYNKDGRLADAAERVRDIVREEIQRNGLAGGRAGDAGPTAKSEGAGATPPDPNLDFADPGGQGFKDQIELTRIDTTPTERAETNVRDLRAMLRDMASPDEIEAHPEVVKALAEMTERAKNETRNRPGYDSNEWHDSRPYDFEGEEVIGTEAAARLWLDQARKFAGDGGPVQGKVATIILGPPAAGKSTIAESLALSKRAAILDGDEIKKTLPEYADGIGAAAVHEESSDLANILERALVEAGDNLIVPKVGGSPGSIRKAIARFKAAGYEVEIINMSVTADEAYRRMIGRFISTGRLIPPAYVREVGDNPSATFRTLKEEGQADGYAEIDNNGGIDAPKTIGEISGRNPFAGSRYDLQPGGREGSNADAGPGADPGGAAQSQIVATDAEAIDAGRAARATMSEPTQAGEQTLIPGVAPITQADRLQARADAPLKARPRGSDSEIGGLFDPFDKVRSDLFDLVPTGRTIDADGNEIPTVMTRKELADDLDADDEAIAVLDICMMGANRS
jgi:predicted ABC-type ATPase